MNAILAIAMKDIRLLLRDRMGFFFAFGFPIMTAIFFGSIFGGGGGGSGEGDGDSGKIDLLLVDEDQTEGSRAFAKTLENASELKVAVSATRDAASAEVRKGNQTAFVALPKGFGASRDAMFFGGGTSIVLGVDPARRAESGMLEGVLTKYGFMQLQQGFQDPEVMRKQVRTSLDRLRSSPGLDAPQKQTFEKFFGDLDQFLVDVPRKSDTKSDTSKPADPAKKSDSTSGPGGFQPIRIEKADVIKQKETAPNSAPSVPPNNYSWTFPQGMIWGFLGCSMSFAVAMVLERTRGTLLRLRVAPLSAFQVLAGKALACFIMTQIVAVLLMLIAYFAFKVRPTSIPTLAVAIVCTGICFVGIMMMLSVVSKSERAAAGLGWGVMLIFSMIGGGMIPLFILKGWMHTLSIISPIRWSILALEGGIWRDMSPMEMLPACAILTTIGVVGFILGAMVFGKAESA